MAKTLLDLLCDADALEINGMFVRYFGLSWDDVEADPDEFLLVLDFTNEDGHFEYYFMQSDLERAEHNGDNSWTLDADNVITPYKVEILT